MAAYAFRTLVSETTGVIASSPLNELQTLTHPDHTPYAHNYQQLWLRLAPQEQIDLDGCKEPIKAKPIKRFQHYARALLTAIQKTQGKQHLHSDECPLTINIRSWISSIETSAQETLLKI